MPSEETRNRAQTAPPTIRARVKKTKGHTVIGKQSGPAEIVAQYELLTDVSPEELNELHQKKKIRFNEKQFKSMTKQEEPVIDVTFGKGYFGRVRLARNLTTGELIADKKIINTDPAELANWRAKNDREKEVHEILKTKNISNLMLMTDSCYVTQNKNEKDSHLPEETIWKMHQFYPLATVGTLETVREFLPKLSVEEKKVFVSKMFSFLIHTVAHMHREGVVHCDFKPDNILFSSDGSARISDFGAAKLYQENIVSYQPGSNIYSAPEYDFTRADFMTDKLYESWRVGLTLLYMITTDQGKVVFEKDIKSTPHWYNTTSIVDKQKFFAELWNRFRNPAEGLIDPSIVSPEQLHTIFHLLAVDPTQRALVENVTPQFSPQSDQDKQFFEEIFSKYHFEEKPPEKQPEKPKELLIKKKTDYQLKQLKGGKNFLKIVYDDLASDKLNALFDKMQTLMNKKEHSFDESDLKVINHSLTKTAQKIHRKLEHKSILKPKEIEDLFVLEENAKAMLSFVESLPRGLFQAQAQSLSNALNELEESHVLQTDDEDAYKAIPSKTTDQSHVYQNSPNVQAPTHHYAQSPAIHHPQMHTLAEQAGEIIYQYEFEGESFGTKKIAVETHLNKETTPWLKITEGEVQYHLPQDKEARGKISAEAQRKMLQHAIEESMRKFDVKDASELSFSGSKRLMKMAQEIVAEIVNKNNLESENITFNPSF